MYSLPIDRCMINSKLSMANVFSLHPFHVHHAQTNEKNKKKKNNIFITANWFLTQSPTGNHGFSFCQRSAVRK